MKVIDFMLNHIGQSVNLGFHSSFVYCDIVSADIEQELKNLSVHYLCNEDRLLSEAIEQKARLTASGVNKYSNRMIKRWIGRHTKKGQEPPVPSRNLIKSFKTQYYARIKQLNRDIRFHEKALESFIPYQECEVKEVYTSLADFKTLIVIGKGNRYVNGKYWTREEYLRDNGKEVFFNV